MLAGLETLTKPLVPGVAGDSVTKGVVMSCELGVMMTELGIQKQGFIP